MKKGLREKARKARAERRSKLAHDRLNWVGQSLDRSLADLAERGEIAKSYGVPNEVIEDVEAKERAEIIAAASRYNERWAEAQKSLDQSLAVKRNQAIRRRARVRKGAALGSGTLMVGALVLWWLTRK